METYPKARLGMESLGAGMLTNMGSTGHVAWDEVDSTGGWGDGECTHQGFKVLAIAAGVGRGKGP